MTVAVFSGVRRYATAIGAAIKTIVQKIVLIA
jgi:hypothetical protein